jgi:hypothetical protein
MSSIFSISSMISLGFFPRKKHTYLLHSLFIIFGLFSCGKIQKIPWLTFITYINKENVIDCLCDSVVKSGSGTFVLFGSRSWTIFRGPTSFCICTTYAILYLNFVKFFLDYIPTTIFAKKNFLLIYKEQLSCSSFKNTYLCISGLVFRVGSGSGMAWKVGSGFGLNHSGSKSQCVTF